MKDEEPEFFETLASTRAGGATPRVASDDDPDAPALIDEYRLLKKLGEGGMGQVWAAEQEQPVHRLVALKLIRLGMDTAHFVARFQAERQALALMDHPAIAKVFDAGTTPDGRPYFVMELVQGVPIHQYCESKKLDLESRLRLFIRACEGVEHAHQKAIIHRDLKPSNILVSFVDGRHLPKIIDFGVAKATGERLTERTMLTQAGSLVGTLEFMSPEQVAHSEDVDTRSDVYSMGVILYELLSGRLPFDGRTMLASTLEQMLRTLRVSEPVRPSEGAPPEIARRLRGDLDWITMRALEKDRERRYASARDLAADLQRHLESKPVLASPPSRSYRFGKFVRRHRAAVAAGGLVAVALLIGLTGTTWGLLRALRAEKEARVAESESRREAAKTKAVNTFLQDMFASAQPEQAQGHEITVRELLDRAAQDLKSETAPESREIEAAVRNTIGVTYQSLGLLEAADPQLRSALSIRTELFGEENADVAVSRHNMGRLLWAKSDYTGAERELREALAVLRRAPGDRREEIASGLADLGVVIHARGAYAEAEPVLREALDLRRALSGNDDGRISEIQNNLAWALRFQGDIDGAVPMFREALARDEKLLGERHPNVLAMQTNLAEMLRMQGKYEEAETLHRTSLDGMRAVLGPEHPTTLVASRGFAELELELGRVEVADPLVRESLAISERTLGRDHTLTTTFLATLGMVERERGDLTGSLASYRASLERRMRTVGPEHPHTIRARWQVARALVDLRRFAEARVEADFAVAGCRKLGAAKDDNLPPALLYQGLALVGEGKGAAAEPLLRECIRLQQEIAPARAWEKDQANGALGAALADQGRFAEAEPLVLESYEAFRENRYAPTLRRTDALAQVLSLYERWNASDPTPERAQTLALWRSNPPQGAHGTP